MNVNTTYLWDIVADHSSVHAVCRTLDHVRHDLVISDTPLTAAEGHDQARTLVKMRALKDVLDPEFSDMEAALYAVANAAWLDNKLLDAARKRWGAADYLAEKWLLGAGKVLAVDTVSWRAHWCVEQSMQLWAMQLMDKSPGAIWNELGMATMFSPSSVRHFYQLSEGLVRLEGTLLQIRRSEHAQVMIILTDSGRWVIVALEHTRSDDVSILSLMTPPTIENAAHLFTSTPVSEIELLLEVK